jgi:DNA transposition AAA+ family ATPase
MRRDLFIETTNVTAFNEAVASLNAETGELGFALAWGQAGRGKTETARRLYAETGGVYLRVMGGWTKHAFLEALCFEVCGMRPRSAEACKRQVIDTLDNEPMTIFVDEADRLHVERIDDLRDIHDMTGAPIVLIGELELKGLLSQRRRIWSRVKQVVEFGPVAAEDVAVLGSDAAGVSIDSEAAAYITRRADGDFRLIWTLLAHLERACQARQSMAVDASLAAAVAKKTMSWRER